MKLKKAGKILMILALVLALLIGGGFAYLYFNGMSGMSKTTEAADNQIKIACVGDSITYGHGTTGWPQNNYPSVLQELLGEGYHVNNYGVSSYAVQDTADRPHRTLPHYQESLAYDADFVVFMMGSNDAKPENWIDDEHFKEALTAILDSYGDAKILLCTVPTAYFPQGQTEGLTNYDIQPAIVDEIADILRQVAEERGYPLIDIHALTARNPQWFEKDGVHPSNEGAAAIAQEVCGFLKAQ